MTVTGRTRVAGVIGDPVDHSRSPAIHNAAFAATGLDWVFVAFLVPAGRGGDAVRAVATLGLSGLNVTMPHKAAAAAACDELSADARLLDAVNTVIPRADGRLIGDSTDGRGLVASLRDEGIDAGGTRCLVLGAGGAARAITLALGREGARVTVGARRPAPAVSTAELAPGAAATTLPVPPGVLAGVDVVVNATPLGMRGEAPPLDPAEIESRHVVVDTVYEPLETPLLAAARARGARVASGLGMLLHQAAAAFEAWTGVEAPLDAMRAAARSVPVGSPLKP